MIELNNINVKDEEKANFKVSKQLQVLEEQIIQKKKNIKIKCELAKLSRHINHRIIMIKGLVLQYELYTTNELRIFSDVDLMVQHIDIDETIKALVSIGYKKKEEKTRHYKYTSDIFVQHLYTEDDFRLKINHLVYQKTLDGIDIVIELHTSFAGERYPSVDYEDIFKRSIEVPHIANGIYKLEPHDMILYQMCHYCKHIGNYIFYNSDHLNVKPRDIHEIAMLIKKYIHKIDWEIIINRAIEWNMLGNLNFCFSILNKLYPELLNTWLIEKVKRLTHQFSDRCSHNAIIDDISFLPVEKILDLDIKETVYKGRINNNAQKFVFSRNINDSENIELHCRYFNSTTTGTWSENRLEFNTEITFKDSVSKNSFNAIMFTLGSETCISGCQSFIIEKGKKKYILKNEWSEPIVSNLILFDIGFVEEVPDQLKIQLTINWNTLNISPKSGLTIPFNIKIFIKTEHDQINLISLAPYKYFNFYNNESIKLAK